MDTKSKTKRGGFRAGGGRPKGSKSRATPEQKHTISEMAKQHAPLALRVLAEIAERGESESARVAAANALLDRGYGRPPQSVELTGDGGGPVLTRIECVIVDPAKED